MGSVTYADDMRREAERRQARLDAGKSLNLTPEELENIDRETDVRLEREIQAECKKLYLANGCSVYETSQKRQVKGVTPGISDLIVFRPRGTKVKHWYHEVKTSTGQLEPSQVNFKQDCELSGVLYIVGGIVVAKNVLAYTAPNVSRENPRSENPFFKSQL